jgi:hypothetical protein
VDIFSPRFVSRLELLWTDTAEVTVAARSIVEAIDVVGQGDLRQFSVLVNQFLDPLLFRTAKERLGDGMVPAVPLPNVTSPALRPAKGVKDLRRKRAQIF